MRLFLVISLQWEVLKVNCSFPFHQILVIEKQQNLAYVDDYIRVCFHYVAKLQQKLAEMVRRESFRSKAAAQLVDRAEQAFATVPKTITISLFHFHLL